MRGQATLEYIVIFGATIAIISIIAASLAAEGTVLRDRAGELEMAVKAESAARAVESMLRCGDMELDFREEGVYHSVEHGRFHARCGDRMTEVGGVFRHDASEPV